MINDLLNSLETKIRRLKEENIKLAQLRTSLYNQNLDLNQILEEQDKQINHLKDQLNGLAGPGGDPGGKKQGVDVKIDQLVREIDHCIELLKK